MLKQAIPLLHVSDVRQAEAFYCGVLGFEMYSSTRAREDMENPCYMVVWRDNVVLHLSSFSGDGKPGGVVNILVENVDRLYDEFLQKNVSVDLQPTDQTWGTREMYVKDTDQNCLRFFTLK